MATAEATAPRPPEHVVFVGNLAFDATEDTLLNIFGPLTVRNVRLIRDPRSGASRGFAFVEFISASAAIDAVRLDGTFVDGRAIRVNIAQRA